MAILRKSALLPGIRNGDSARELLFFQLHLARDVARARPDFAPGLMLYGNLLTEAGRHAEALESDRKLVEADPADPAAWYNLGCSLSLTGQAEEALDTLEHAIDLGFDDDALMERDKDLEALRALPRFRKLLGRLQGEQRED